MRSREEVLREFGAHPLASYKELEAASNDMADRIRELEAEKESLLQGRDSERIVSPVAASEAPASPGIRDAEPVAWGVMGTDGRWWSSFYEKREDAEKMALASDFLVPLYTHPSVAEVVELDEWRVVDRDGKPALFLRGAAKLDVAQESVHDQDHRWPELAPHRVMRVCLKEVDV